MENFLQYEKIEAYLKGELSAEAAQAFELEIAQNTDLREQVELHRLEHDAMEVLIENDLRQKMTAWHQAKTTEIGSDTEGGISTAFSTPMTAQRGGLFRGYVLAIAAAFALMTGASLWYFNRPNPIDDVTKPTEINTLPKPTDSSEMLDGAALPPELLENVPNSPALDSAQRAKKSSQKHK